MGIRSFIKAAVFCAPLALAGCVEMPDALPGATVATPEPVSPPPSPAQTDATPPQPTEASAPAQQPSAATPIPAPAAPVSDTSAPHVELADTSTTVAPATPAWQPSVDVLCEQIGNKLSSISSEDCMEQQFVFGGAFSVNQRPLVFREHQPAAANADFRVLIMGGIHGDEYSSISILFKWLALFSPDAIEGTFHWRFAPLVNPDGLLDGSQAKRQNANGVDLNRNFPSRDWNDTAAHYWQVSTGSNPRRFPGASAGSEPEVQWVVQQIEEFQPDVIVSVHAPYHLLDFDGPAEAPAKIGELYLHQLGVYPGSLGNFAGLNRQIPVVTLELPSAGIMPPAEQIELMWNDLVAWLDREGRKGLRQL
jgi:murein peptide amidase A